MSENKGELIIYQTEDGLTKIDVRMDNETVWLSLEQMSDLFQRDKSTISRHIKNVFQDLFFFHNRCKTQRSRKIFLIKRILFNINA